MGFPFWGGWGGDGGEGGSPLPPAENLLIPPPPPPTRKILSNHQIFSPLPLSTKSQLHPPLNNNFQL